MRQVLTTFAVLASLAAVTAMAGCDHEVKHSETTVRSSDGTVQHKDTTVTEKANGDVVTESHKVTNP